MSVSHLFVYNCCSETKPEAEATEDEQLGFVCDDCRQNIRGGLAWLRKCVGMPIRPLVTGDINPYNHKRFQNP